jgi:hypothetical protein
VQVAVTALAVQVQVGQPLMMHVSWPPHVMLQPLPDQLMVVVRDDVTHEADLSGTAKRGMACRTEESS